MEEPRKLSQQELVPIVLQYDKRRYDGGSEIELIRYIEAKLSLEEDLSSPVTQEPLPGAPKIQLPGTETGSLSDKISQIVVTGPLEMAVGAVGIVTTLLAIAVFHWSGNEPMVHQSRTIFKDCVRSLIQGTGHTLSAPVKVVKTVLAK